MKKIIALFLIIIVSMSSVSFAMDDDIHRAAELGDLVRVQEILHANPDAVNARDQADETPLHYAAIEGHEAVARILLEHGADVNARNDLGLTPLPYAAFEDYEAVARILLEHRADVNARDIRNRIPLHWAAEKDHTDVAQLLLENRADVNARDDLRWETPLNVAAERGHEAFARFLLENRADVHARDAFGLTPLDGAVLNGHTSIEQLLRDWPMYRAYMSHHMPIDQAIAFLQAMHPRLGQHSAAHVLCPDLYVRILSLALQPHTFDEIHQIAEQQRALELEEQRRRERELAEQERAEQERVEQERVLEQEERKRRNRTLSRWLGGGAAVATVATMGVFAYRFYKRR